jgi:phosphomannomutase
VRPSGTEPKVKAYIDASSAEGTAAERRSLARATVDRLAAGVSEFLY